MKEILLLNNELEKKVQDRTAEFEESNAELEEEVDERKKAQKQITLMNIDIIARLGGDEFVIILPKM